ncbi:MAG: 6-carboxytetrahydropterin synthase [Candidatus Omnitrophota bacterium]
MYEILIRSDFSGAHNLRGYKGKCEELHGHNWKIEARFEGNELNDIGLAEDFALLRSKLKDLLKKIDHKYLNDVDEFKKKNPSAENIAKYIYDSLIICVKNDNISVKSVSVWESDNACATYYE